MKSASLKTVSAVETSLEASNRGPSLFTGMAFSIDEIAKAVTAQLRAAQDMRAAQTIRSQADLKASLEQLAEHANVVHVLAKHGAGIVAKHQARRPRA